MPEDIHVITLDGPSGTGKGTLALMLANHLGWNYLDSGAIYRVLAYIARKKHLSFDDADPLVLMAKQLPLKFQVNEQHERRVFVENQDVTEDIRTEECGQDASKLGSNKEIRLALVERQRAFAKLPGLVTDGRDMGTVIFPKACLKLFLTASVEERAKRRYLQLKDSQINANLASVLAELQQRDARDTKRSVAPLVPAADAITMDTTSLSIVQTFNFVLQLVDERLK